MKSRVHNLALATVAMASFSLALTANRAETAILAQEDFAGSSGTNLVGTTADIGGTWTGTGGLIKEDGSVTAAPSSVYSAYQAFTLVPGAVYTLTATMDVTSAGGWFGIGFSHSDASGTVSFGGPASPSPWMFLRGDGEVVRARGPGLVDFPTIASSGSHTGLTELAIELDTTTPSWTATWFINGSPFHAGTTLGTPALTHAMIMSHEGNGSFESFLLEDDSVASSGVPEPSTYALALLGLAGLGLAAAARRGGVGRKE